MIFRDFKALSDFMEKHNCDFNVAKEAAREIDEENMACPGTFGYITGPNDLKKLSPNTIKKTFRRR